jgi:hypothetical protein
MHRLMIPLAVAEAAAATSATLAQERPAQECGDDNGVDRCAAEQHPGPRIHNVRVGAFERAPRADD